MLNCNTLIIKKSVENNDGLSIGDLKLKVNGDGKLRTTDKDGVENIIGDNISQLKYLKIDINDTIQVLYNNNELEILFDENLKVPNNIDFELGDDNNSVKILKKGYYFVSFNITLDMYKGSRSTVKGYIKIKLPNDNYQIVTESESYNLFYSQNVGFSTIPNSFLHNFDDNEEIKFFVKREEGNGCFYTVPLSTNFSIFKLE